MDFTSTSSCNTETCNESDCNCNCEDCTEHLITQTCVCICHLVNDEPHALRL